MFCTNCGTADPSPTLCQACGLDPFVPEATLSRHLRLGDTSVTSAASLIEFPGESTSLLLAIAILTVVSLVLSAVTAGIFLLLLVVALIGVRLSEYQQRAHMQIAGPAGTYARIFNIARLAAFRLDVPLPPVYIASDNAPNAYTSGFWGRHWVVLHSSLVTILTPDEVGFVIGHELGHVRREHVTWLILTSARSAAGLALLRPAVGPIFNNWHLKAEYSADRAGLLACRRFDSAARALIKITFWDGPVDIDGVLASALSSPELAPADRLAELLGDHPFLANRLKRLREFHAELQTQGVL